MKRILNLLADLGVDDETVVMVSVASDHGNSITTAQAVSFDETITGSISSTLDVDLYAVEVANRDHQATRAVTDQITTLAYSYDFCTGQ